MRTWEPLLDQVLECWPLLWKGLGQMLERESQVEEAIVPHCRLAAVPQHLKHPHKACRIQDAFQLCLQAIFPSQWAHSASCRTHSQDCRREGVPRRLYVCSKDHSIERLPRWVIKGIRLERR